jgi:hypothetical protein
MKTQNCPPSPFNFKALVDAWPAPLVARSQKQLDRFSGGLLNAKTLANHDSLGTGPKGKVRIGNKVAYPKLALAEWLKERFEKTPY